MTRTRAKQSADARINKITIFMKYGDTAIFCAFRLCVYTPSAILDSVPRKNIYFTDEDAAILLRLAKIKKMSLSSAIAECVRKEMARIEKGLTGKKQEKAK
jgi:hypothetical protein